MVDFPEIPEDDLEEEEAEEVIEFAPVNDLIHVPIDRLEKTLKLTTPCRFKLTTPGRTKMTTFAGAK